MARKEKPIDPGAGPLASFARDLRALRRRAGHPTYRLMARRAGYSVTTLSVAASGTRLPALDVTLAYVEVCGGDVEDWRERWYRLAAQLASGDSEGVLSDAVPEEYARALAEVAPAETGLVRRVVHALAGEAETRRRHRAWSIATAATALLAVVLLVMLEPFAPGHSRLPRGIGRSSSPPQETGYSTPPHVSGHCRPVATAMSGPQAQGLMSPYPETTRDSDVQKVPGQIPRIAPALGDLVLNPDHGWAVVESPLLNMLAPDVEDGYIADYLDTGRHDGPGNFVTVDIATPKPGICPEELAYDGLSLFNGGGSVGLEHSVLTGPHLTAANATLECGNGGGLPNSVYNTCAWAGPADGSGTAFFGEFWIYPDVNDRAIMTMTAQQSAAFADALFAAFTA